ncbi:MAG: molybdopterin oxidoreductase family protein [Limisphaerales bacterium]|jgi:assimilatory nitrate reductase catalytic subunit|nr:nitrate reductase [Verrucomicrobiae bacterium]RZO73223.1 MAG: nitrate reductase [Limisphaerales bacterium]
MKLFHRFSQMLKERQGPLTEELRLSSTSSHGMLPDRLLPDKTSASICGYCSTGCQLHLHSKKNKPINVTASASYPVNLGAACPKGWESLSVLDSKDRGTMPLLKDVNGRQQIVSWDIALETFCSRFKSIQKLHGNESTAWIGTGQITNEDLALLGALAKFGMGWVHGDGNTRQCMASAVTAYKQTFGFDAPPYTYADLEASDTLVFVGSNPCIAHPILWQRVMRNQRHPDIIVIDPRMTETAAAASLHLPIRPKSDLTLFYALARIFIQNQWVDSDFVKNHTNDYDAFATFVESFTLERAALTTGLKESTIMNLAARIHEKTAVSFWWTMGVNQGYQGTRTAQAIINLALLTGNIGRPGTGANSITGQCNAMGSRLFSNTTSLFGGRDFQNQGDREEVAKCLKIPVARIPTKNSLAYDQILKQVDAGKIKGLWIVATNPGHSWIDQSNWLRLVRTKVDFLVVQDMYYSTETAQEADLYLPAAGWGEKLGTFINSERRLGVIEPITEPPGESRSDFDIFKSIACQWGCGDMFTEWKDPASTFQILKRLTRGRPCDISGIKDYAMLQREGGIQWPFSESHAKHGSPEKERRLFGDGSFYHPDQRARFLFESVQPPTEPPDSSYPFWLLSGRGTSAQWHTQTRTGKSPMLLQMAPAALYVELHPKDAVKLNIRHNEKVQIISRRGSVEATAKVMATVQPGQVFIPMHYQEVNRLTHPSFDSYSRQPSYKACAVQLNKVS